MEPKSNDEPISDKKERICLRKKLSAILRNALKPVKVEEEHTITERDEMYEDFNVEKYKIVCTLDMETCSICGDLDGQVFDTKDRKVGVNAPPFHKDCRCVDVPYFDDFKLGGRIARNAQGKSYYLPYHMNYNEWKKSLKTDDEESL